MTRPAIEVADIARAKRSQFFERYHSSLSYQQAKAYGAVVRTSSRGRQAHTMTTSVAESMPRIMG